MTGNTRIEVFLDDIAILSSALVIQMHTRYRYPASLSTMHECLLSQLYSTTIFRILGSDLLYILYATANLETCRPFIRVVKDDLLLTTSSYVDWNLNEELCYEGVVFLLLMLMSPIRPQYPKLSFERIHSVMEVMEKESKGKYMSGWGKFYSNCGKKYEGIVHMIHCNSRIVIIHV